MVRRLFKNYYASYGSKIQKSTRFDAQKSTQFLLHKNRPNFYCTKIDPIFIAQKSTQFLLHKNRPDF